MNTGFNPLVSEGAETYIGKSTSKAEELGLPAGARIVHAVAWRAHERR